MSQNGDGPRSLPTIHDSRPEDKIRILLATDNHIGYLERDPVRGQDSINTFREILQLAVKNDVDFVLLAGDLFHENRPSRDSLYKTIALLREYTLGDRPIQVELLSDPNEGKAESFSFPAINYEDPNFNVGIPVFSIHGNHDDPQGAGHDGALCALDVLSVSGLVNYMGKFDLPVDDSDAHNSGMAVRPVLLRKGNTYLGMYGVGNVKDQRMHFELQSNRVRIFMPRDREKWFNIFILHQNRVRHGPQEYVPEGLFDDSFDLVVWGHEHDCRINPEPVTGKNYFITQPGSSVATSLADGESIEKQVALLEIQGKEFQLKPIPLRTVRPFVIEDIVLSEVAEDASFELTDQIAITKYLKGRVNALIERANALWEERNAKAVEEGEKPLPPMLPLIRLKVDTTGVSEMSNPIRFGQEFQGRIANPRDVLVFHRSKRSSANTGPGTGGNKVVIDQPELSIDDPNLGLAERLAKVRVQTLVREYLAAQELQLLGEIGMSDAIQVFVEKDDPHAIQSHVSAALKTLMQGVQTTELVDEDELEDILAKAKERHEKEYAEKASKASKSKGKSKATRGKAGEEEDDDAASVDSMAMDVDAQIGSDFEELVESYQPPPTKKRGAAAAKATTSKAAAPAKKAATQKTTTARGRGKKAVVQSESEDDVEVAEDDEEEEVVPKKKTNRAAVLSQATTSKKASAKKATTGGSKQTSLSFAPSGRKSTRAAATRARGKMVEVDDSD